MTNIEKIALMENRLMTLKERSKNIKSGGVVKKLSRQLRNMKNQ